MQKPISQQGQRHHFDAIVIGTGIAGLSYVLELAHLQPDCKIALIVKEQLTTSNSFYAQGGIAASLDDEIALASHAQDTLTAGANLSHENIVEKIIKEGPACIEFLLKHKVSFSKTELAQEGGHSERRIYHRGDQTGRTIIEALITAVKSLSQVQIFEHHSAVNLITQSEPHTPGDFGEVIGCYILNINSNCIDTFLAPATVLATGGAGKTFRYTSNPDTATGDGIAMAYRAGARVGNLEFYQFHPTLLYHPQKNNLLISETLRGEGAQLLNAKGDRFMRYYDCERMELSTRDIVARAIFTEIESTTESCVYLDIRHQSKKFLQQRFPYISGELQQLGIDISKDLIPVVPAAHYLCGGVLTDINGQTDLKRLFAVGETSFTGFHGANRLASNSLLEACVTARFAAVASSKVIQQPISKQRQIEDWNSKLVTDLRRASQINAHWRGLRGEMTSYAGIVRTEAGLKDLLQLILTRKRMIENYYRHHVITRDVIELRNIVLVAKLIIDSALMRTESRGGHYREDYPNTWKKSCDTILRAKALHFDSE